MCCNAGSVAVDSCGALHLLHPYALLPRAVVVAARAARIEVRNKQQKSFVVRAGLSAVDEVVRGRWRADATATSRQSAARLV